jgi:DNA gyrase inhibitor GyrI
MSKVRTWRFALLAIGLVAAMGVIVCAEYAVQKPSFAIRKVDKKVVLYTIHRGSYDKTGLATGKLFALAGQKGITPQGPVSYAYLNNPELVSSEHWLTEIRIPVAKEALKFAGTLGEMTDVKTLSAAEVAVAIKAEGQADPGPIYEGLQLWIIKQGYMASEGPIETFLTNVMSGDYGRMKTEIMIPIQKLPGNED